MRSLYLRIWVTVVVALGLYAAVSVWLMQRHMDQRMDQERQRAEVAMQGRAEAWAELLSKALPGAKAPASEQRAALQEWSSRLRLPMALDDAKGTRIAASDSFERREAEGLGPRRMIPIALQDGRTLTILRGPGLRRGLATHSSPRSAEIRRPCPRSCLRLEGCIRFPWPYTSVFTRCDPFQGRA